MTRLEADPLILETADGLLDDMKNMSEDLNSAWDKKWDERLK